MADLSERQKLLLRTVVREYIDTAQPVGSSTINCKYHDFDCSPATIRNELAELERLGYLTHPYTSAGRIPTDVGYRFYVDELMDAYRLTMREKNLVDNLQQMLTRDVQSLMQETLRTIQSISTQYAAIVKTNDGILAELTGTVQRSMDQSRQESVYLSGLSKMFYEPEFENVDNIRKMMGVLDQKERFIEILDEYSDPKQVRVSIGSEINDADLKDFSLVTKNFTYHGQPVGSIGVLGPTRMQYGKMTAAINTIAEVLDDLFDRNM
jgi:heat-inducible transcriptional repressor